MSDDLVINLIIEDDGSISITVDDDRSDDRDDPVILPCPCCGGKAVLNVASLVWVECRDCHMQTESYESAEDCLGVWNRRIEP